jgi:hypothetical protein
VWGWGWGVVVVIVIGFINTYMYAISTYYWSYEFEFAHGEVYSIQYVIKFVSDLRQVSGFLRVLQFPTPLTLTAKIYLNIVENGV